MFIADQYQFKESDWSGAFIAAALNHATDVGGLRRVFNCWFGGI